MTAPNLLKAGVIGWPIAHSKSPLIHGHWLQEHGISGQYTAIASEPDKFPETIRSLQSQGFKGANVTLPFKGQAIDIATTITPAAQAIGAANTLTFGADGSIDADNTDGIGFVNNLKQNAPRWSASSGPALVLGAGGAARAILHSLLTNGTPRIYLTNRSQNKADALAEAFGDKITVLPWEHRASVNEQVKTVVNTTSLGMVKQPPLDFSLAQMNSGALVTDIVYNPLETNLLKNAQSAGLMTVDGLGMLLHQAVPGFERWFGVHPTVTPELRTKIVAQL